MVWLWFAANFARYHLFSNVTTVVTFTFRQPMHILMENAGMGRVCVDKIGDTDQDITVSVKGGMSQLVQQGLYFIKYLQKSSWDLSAGCWYFHPILILHALTLPLLMIILLLSCLRSSCGHLILFQSLVYDWVLTQQELSSLMMTVS